MRNLNPKLISRKKAKRLGLKRYFTGKPCPKGHIDERDVAGRHCYDCKREEIKRYNPDWIYKPNLKQHLWNKLSSAKGHKKSKRATGINFSKNVFFNWYDKNYNHKCYYCEISVEEYKKRKIYLNYGLTAKNFGIDRKDSGKNYQLNNIAVSCTICNTVKSFVFEAEEFKEIAKKYIRKLYG